jgi:hypothetical protein
MIFSLQGTGPVYLVSNYCGVMMVFDTLDVATQFLNDMAGGSP